MVKPGLYWSPQNFGNVGIAVKESYRLGVEAAPKERSMLQLTKLKGAGVLKSILPSDMEISECGVCPAGLQCCFGPHFLPVLWLAFN